MGDAHAADEALILAVIGTDDPDYIFGHGQLVNLVCEPDDVPQTAVFFCSDESRHVNGAVASVVGGVSAC